MGKGESSSLQINLQVQAEQLGVGMPQCGNSTCVLCSRQSHYKRIFVSSIFRRRNLWWKVEARMAKIGGNEMTEK